MTGWLNITPLIIWYISSNETIGSMKKFVKQSIILFGRGFLPTSNPGFIQAKTLNPDGLITYSRLLDSIKVIVFWVNI